LREELAWRRQLLRTLQIMQMKPAYSAELETLQKHERWMRGYVKQAKKWSANGLLRRESDA
jgi:hypothetical protein